jgi:hypothetical protein
MAVYHGKLANILTTTGLIRVLFALVKAICIQENEELPEIKTSDHYSTTSILVPKHVPLIKLTLAHHN